MFKYLNIGAKNMAGYTTQFNSQPGDKVDADLFADEYTLVSDAFKVADGHFHNGDSDGGG